eukprot:scaffold245521_cov28-Tisochrysis_lutea.AAC.2
MRALDATSETAARMGANRNSGCAFERSRGRKRRGAEAALLLPPAAAVASATARLVATAARPRPCCRKISASAPASGKGARPAILSAEAAAKRRR